jgi:uncharacterized BrkB/YihY/UPF0761 family membrane protein
MDVKKLIPIICILSVAVMVVWGVIANDWSKSWIAVFVGGIIVTCLSIWGKSKKQ